MNGAKMRYINILMLSIVSLALAVFGSYLATGNYLKVLHFNMVAYYLNYQELGFVRRGLVGTFIYAFDLREPREIVMVSYGIILLAAVAFWAWVISFMGSIRNAFWYYLFFILSPALFLHFGYDLGRHDALNIFFLIVGLWLIRKNYYFLPGAIAGMAVLNHESFLFAHVPVLAVFAWCAQAAGFKNGYANFFKIVSPPLLAHILILFYGGTEVPIDVVAENMSKFIQPNGAHSYYLEFTSIKINIISSLVNFIGSWKLNIYSLFVLLGYFSFVFFGLFQPALARGLKAERMLIIASLSPLFILFLATDKGRWISMALANAFLVLPFLYESLKKNGMLLRKSMVGFMLATGVILGPITISGMYVPAKLDKHLVEPRVHIPELMKKLQLSD